MSELNPEEPMYGAWVSTNAVRGCEEAMVLCKKDWFESWEGRRRKASENRGGRACEEVASGSYNRKEEGRVMSGEVLVESKSKGVVNEACGEEKMYYRGSAESVYELREKLMGWTGKIARAEGSNVDWANNMRNKETEAEYYMENEEGEMEEMKEEVEIMEEGKILKVEEVEKGSFNVSASGYIVEIPSDGEEGERAVVPYVQNSYLREVMMKLKKVKIKREAEEVNSPPDEKRRKVLEKAVSLKATVEVFEVERETDKEEKKRSKGKEKKKKKERKIKEEEGVNELVEVPIDVMKEIPNDWFVFKAGVRRVEGDNQVVGSGGWPEAATQAP